MAGQKGMNEQMREYIRQIKRAVGDEKSQQPYGQDDTPTYYDIKDYGDTTDATPTYRDLKFGQSRTLTDENFKDLNLSRKQESDLMQIVLEGRLNSDIGESKAIEDIIQQSNLIEALAPRDATNVEVKGPAPQMPDSRYGIQPDPIQELLDMADPIGRGSLEDLLMKMKQGKSGIKTS